MLLCCGHNTATYPCIVSVVLGLYPLPLLLSPALAHQVGIYRSFVYRFRKVHTFLQTAVIHTVAVHDVLVRAWVPELVSYRQPANGVFTRAGLQNWEQVAVQPHIRAHGHVCRPAASCFALLDRTFCEGTRMLQWPWGIVLTSGTNLTFPSASLTSTVANSQVT
jgi:hypothetical protein